ncbi:hypothetical protein Ade02nite_59190 [Paractinoplanes deccanensis]|uniref:Uncharacterized protein n=1 Tax=Paractinoplanes deccanensis TaxID=113561 RepID=A0ABQ3YBC0_9ACTN|nr:hypothetical protein Ade02nite_59190 [Actinoplanes deccanensis]
MVPAARDRGTDPQVSGRGLPQGLPVAVTVRHGRLCTEGKQGKRDEDDQCLSHSDSFVCAGGPGAIGGDHARP